METTDVLLVDLASGGARELIARSVAEANETYETYVSHLRWLDDRHVEVTLSDGDVGSTDLLVDASSGKILRTDQTEEGDALVPAEFAAVAADWRFYSRHFSREELEQSLGSSAIRLKDGTILVQRTPRKGTTRALFHIDTTRRRVERVANVPDALELWSAVRIGREIAFLLAGKDEISVHSYGRRQTRKLAAWSHPLRKQCPRIQAFAGRLFVFVRPCDRSEPARATLWEVISGTAIIRPLDPDLDEVSASADGSIIAAGAWRNGRRIVQVFRGDVLRPAPTPIE